MSTSTVVCAFEMNEAAHSGTGFLMRGETAEALLHLLEPMQVGYGAVVSVSDAGVPTFRY